jgi:hypothetical protein
MEEPHPWMISFRWPRGVFQAGPEGNWSTFPLNVGTPGQDFNVLVSTNTPYLALPFPEYCERNPDPYCGSSRGALQFLGQPSDGFSTLQSSSWIAANKTDVIRVGWSVDDFNNTDRDIIDVAQPERQFLGMMGLRALPSHTFGYSWLGIAYLDGKDSFLQTLLRNTVVSWTFGYTAGAAYRK